LRIAFEIQESEGLSSTVLVASLNGKCNPKAVFETCHFDRRNGTHEVSESMFFDANKFITKNRSDIDLAIKGKEITHELRDQWQSDYEELYLPWKLDIVIYEFIHEPNLREHIDRVGRLLLTV